MTGKLSAVRVAKLKTPGMYGDGGGLWLQVTGNGAKSWIFRFTLRGKARAMGLGSASTFSLVEARDKALVCRKLCAEGVDPIEARKAERQGLAAKAAHAMTFRQSAETYIATHQAGWRNAKHTTQWSTTLETYVHPVFGDLPVVAVDTGLVMRVLEPIWTNKSETANRLRGRIEAILDWARTRGYHTGENPARWRGHLENLLPARSKIRRVEHHAALPFTDIPQFLTTLRTGDSIAAHALKYTILTAARTGEVLDARWGEIDLVGGVWTVPAQRMKGGREHRVPLSGPALAILMAMAELRTGDFVFPSVRSGGPLGASALRRLLRTINYANVTVHGFRSSFRDWAAEITDFPSEVVEAALAHTVESKVVRAYRRSDLFQKRRELMDAWARYCMPQIAA
ncbi:tyrosine-type recombinase/integrase [Methylobacterium sp. WSM2598]|uniref:tyrosine-type recombinase/integrase n=1 Tax=Methylobacterium sp. WSM2598 TaxID=398261 RepID=UPI0003733358|nr:integrase arm-type DNA-binding domain-containing protein [Methylobacterium sp. WSM2598]